MAEGIAEEMGGSLFDKFAPALAPAGKASSWLHEICKLRQSLCARTQARHSRRAILAGRLCSPAESHGPSLRCNTSC